MDDRFGPGGMSAEEVALLRQMRTQMLGGFGEPAAGLGPDEEHLLGSAYQGSIWATLAVKALRELLIRKGLISEAEIVAYTNEVVRREWNEVIEQTAPAGLAPKYLATDPDEFPRLRLSDEASDGEQPPER
jgi:hypothetical protein